MMQIFEDHPEVHFDVEWCSQAGESATVLCPGHWAVGRQREIAESYDGEPALLTWTSGSTGDPKAVVIPWPAVAARCAALAAYWDPADIAVTTSLLRANHSGGIITSRLAVHRAGGEFVEFPGRRGVTCLIGTPHRLRQVLATEHRLPSVTDENFLDLIADLRLVITNGTPLSDVDRSRFELAYSARVVDLYGTSESGGVSFDGVPLSGYEVETRNGRLYVRSAAMASRYVSGPLAVVDGWLDTKDEAPNGLDRRSSDR